MYTTKEYKKHLNPEHVHALEKLYAAMHENNKVRIEKELLSILTWIIARNPEGNEINLGDFSTIMLLMNDLDNEYLKWAYRNGYISMEHESIGGNKLLVNHFKHSREIEILMEEVFHYLEHDYFTPSETILAALAEFEEKHTITTLTNTKS